MKLQCVDLLVCRVEC